MPQARVHSEDIEITTDATGTPTLSVETRGSRGRISSVANVTFKNISRCGNFKSQRYTMFQDYTRTIQTLTVKRCTQKQVDACHAQAMQQLDEIQQEALSHYAT